MTLPEHKQIIIFDGVCNLCKASAQFIIKNDKNDLFRFASNQSEIGQEIIRINKINIQALDSIILFNPVKGVSTESEAAFKIAKELRGLYHYIYFFIYLPRSFTDYCYKFIAKNRYKWFGKKDQCALPTPFLQAKFLS